MLVRLLLGLVKGLVIGGLIGFALAKLGFAAPGALVAYLSAALVGALVGLVAGKPIWAADGKIEAGLKAGFGAVLALGLMWLTRRFLTFGLPFDLGALAEANRSLHETADRGTIGGLAVTSLALVAAVLGGFYDADNTPDSGAKSDASKGQTAGASPKARIKAAPGADLDEDLGLDEDVPQKKQAKR
ncbi:MAG: hypothetical protein HOW73_35000 [Polyangiaceae bacterium]|nr:hypothetical protein [Polyangiaceae bacterium]